ncbi:MAG: hypothetical protein CM15mP80_08680 [Alphaproteobacteria bacterium]|nr:MAG: hypothetical protein CM15mP80_08680 [Alphaproteobacteria bacterium]
MSISITATLPLAAAADAKIVMFKQPANREEHFAILVLKIRPPKSPLGATAPQCVTGDILGGPEM